MKKLPLSDWRHKYHCQRQSAIMRGIDWHFTFEDWYQLWLDSGHIHERGRTIGKYCMSRYKDEGPYSPTNVFIQLWTQNTSDAHKGKPKLANRGKPAHNRKQWDDMSVANKKLLYKNSDPRVPYGWVPPPYKKREPTKQVVCPHCGKIGGENVMQQWHFDNCKQKGDQ